jgi:hypothetical protein
LGEGESAECDSHGKGNEARQTHNVSIGPSQDRGGSAREMGKGETRRLTRCVIPKDLACGPTLFEEFRNATRQVLRKLRMTCSMKD